MNGVVPIGPVDSTHGNPNPSQFLYELAPAHDLPHLDFSVSICSWFVDRSWQPILTSFTRRRKALIACNIVGVVFNMVVITGNARTGRAVAPLVLLLQSPLPLSGILLLRYNMVRQLLRTYDVWFLFLTVTSSVIVLMIQLSDIRIVVIFSVWLSLMPNVFIDANSSGGRRVTIAHVVGLLATSLFLVIERLRGIDGIHNFTLFYYRRHQLSADAFVFNGFATIVAMLLRNLVRSRAKENRRHGVEQLRCVSYRCDLCLLPQAEARRRTRTILTTIPSINAPSPSEMAKIAHRLQPLRLVKESAAMDARHTICPCVMNKILCSSVVTRATIGIAGACSFFLFFVNTGISFIAKTNERAFYVQVASAVVSAAFFVVSIACFERRLLWDIVTCFDFLYLSANVTIIHLTVCVYYSWACFSYLTAILSWSWIHWAMCVDALSPLSRRTMRVHLRLPAVVYTFGVFSAMGFLYSVIVLDDGPQPFERVLWVIRVGVEFRLMPLFFGCIANVFLFSVRLLHRAWIFKGDELVILDGPVKYENSFAEAIS